MEKWHAVTSEIEFIRAPYYGAPYTAMVTFKVVDGELRGVRLMTKDGHPFTKDDYIEIEGMLHDRGFEAYKMGRYSNGELRILTRRIRDRREKDRRKDK